MLKNIKIYFVVALATLVILGCESDSDKNSDVPNFVQKSDTKVTMDKLRSLGGDNNISNSGISKSASKFSEQQVNESGMDGECNSGSMDFVEKKDYLSFSAINCNDGDVLINGSATFSGNENGGSAKVLERLTISDEIGGGEISVEKDSQISMTTDKSGTIIFAANFQATIDNEEFSANNLKIVVSISETGGYFDIQTGKVRAGELYFEVDPDTTPIVVSKDGFVRGAIKLTDGSGQKMEVSVASKDKLAFKIDEDGDGEFSDGETTIENIEDFFDELSKEYDKY